MNIGTYLEVLPSGLPKEQVFVLRNIEVSRVLLHRRIAEAWLRETQLVLLERRMGNQLICDMSADWSPR